MSSYAVYLSLLVKGKVWSEWNDWSPCMKDWQNECSHHRQRYCFEEDRTKCGAKVDDFGVETVQEKCKEDDCNGVYQMCYNPSKNLKLLDSGAVTIKFLDICGTTGIVFGKMARPSQVINQTTPLSLSRKWRSGI